MHFTASRQNRPAKRGTVKHFIDPKRFIKSANPSKPEAYVSVHSFDDFAVHDLIRKAITARQFRIPTPIQDQAIPIGLSGKDVVGIANTGTGKTAAFAIPVLQRLLNNHHSRALILAPTRELAQQIEQEFRLFAAGSSIKQAVLIGGASMHLQKVALKARPAVIIGTPGRIKDHVSQGTLSLSSFDTLVLDEVDRMLDMGFITDIRHLLSGIQKQRQSFFFSATMEPKIEQLINTFAKDPIRISVKSGETSENVDQSLVRYHDNNDRIGKLHDLLIKADSHKFIIFDDTKRSVEKLGRELYTRGFKVDFIHGDRSQNQRSRAIKGFKDGTINVLVATDVAARGIDVPNITHVINYSQPNTFEDYVHRIGRVGRAGKTGFAITFLPE